MKKIISSTFIAILALAFVVPVHAAGIDCSPIDGAAIYGQTSDGGYKFIGGIFNKYDTESIADRYGKGSKYDSDSIFDPYGDFGSKYSDYSAMSDFSLHPPVVVDSDYNILGFLSIAEQKDDINPFYAYICAAQSYATNWVNE